MVSPLPAILLVEDDDVDEEFSRLVRDLRPVLPYLDA